MESCTCHCYGPSGDRDIPMKSTIDKVHYRHTELGVGSFMGHDRMIQPKAELQHSHPEAPGDSFALVGPATYEASLATSEPDTPLEHAQRLLLGPPIPETLASRERLNRVRALATLSSDALSSVAYATEASLAVLVAAGAAALSANLFIGLATAALMIIVGYSYRQTIRAYPSGGGSYIVAKANLGTLAGLVAAAALLIDYLLTVSVSVASGIDAIAAAVPALTPGKVAIEVGAIVFITLINLRGMRASGTIFAFPTYLFLSTFGLMIVAGLAQAVLHGGLGSALHPNPAALPTIPIPLTLMVILTAFASGCSAMTGVEAISNGVPAFEGATPEEQSRHAAQTLVIMVTLLVAFFLGTTYLAWRVGAVAYANGDPTVTAQIAHFAFRGPFGWLFYVVQTATLLILVFAANTSFADFPRLASILSRDEFLPALFAYRGERIAFSAGILLLGGLSTIVLVIFRGNVVALINLYALGVFVAFTLSQSGMVVHWLHRRQEPGWQERLAANGVGAVATGIVALIIAIAKFDRGAWVVVLLIPLLVLSFLGIRAYYERPRILLIAKTAPPQQDVVIMPIFSHQMIHTAARTSSSRTTHEVRWPKIVKQELRYAAKIAPVIEVVQVAQNQSEADAIHAAWQTELQSLTPELRQSITVTVMLSPYRTIVLPLANFLHWQAQGVYAGKSVAVLLPVEAHPAWWEWPLQRRVAARVGQQLKTQGDLTVIELPYTLA